MPAYAGRRTFAIRFLLEGEQSGGSVAVFEFDFPARANVPVAHSHDAYEETLYGLEGVLTWTIDGDRRGGRPRRRALHPARRRPQVRKRRRIDATQPAIVSPGILSADYFREVAAAVEAAAGRPTPPPSTQSCAATALPPPP